jgi:glycerophosphoryl diester phosphodiesterase
MPALHRVAHRGYSAVAPENTLPALAAAVLAGATFVEFDVRTSADGVPVVIHDRTVDRTTDGTGHVWELTCAEIGALDAGSWFSPAYAGLSIPLLSDVLDLLAPHAAGPDDSPAALHSDFRRGPAPAPAQAAGVVPNLAGPVELLLEIKPPATTDQVAAILAQVDNRGLLGRTVVQSFDPDVVRRVGEVAPEVRRGLLRHGFDAEQVAIAKDLGLDYCNPSLVAVLDDPGTVAELRENGVRVMPWTANDPQQWPALVDAGVAGLITDHAGTLTGWTNLA